jgi:hypothetical protein
VSSNLKSAFTLEWEDLIQELDAARAADQEAAAQKLEAANKASPLSDDEDWLLLSVSPEEMRPKADQNVPATPIKNVAHTPNPSYSSQLAPVSLEPFENLDLTIKKLDSLKSDLQWVKTLIHSTQFFNSQMKDVMVWENSAPFPFASYPSLKYFLDMIDEDFAEYFTGKCPPNKGVSHIMKKHFPKNGDPITGGQFSSEYISNILTRNNLSGPLDNVPIEHRDAAMFYIFLKYCLAKCKFFTQISPRYDENGQFSMVSEKLRWGTIWSLYFFVDCEEPIGKKGKTTRLNHLEIIFSPRRFRVPTYMLISSAFPINSHKFQTSYAEGFFRKIDEQFEALEEDYFGSISAEKRTKEPSQKASDVFPPKPPPSSRNRSRPIPAKKPSRRSAALENNTTPSSSQKNASSNYEHWVLERWPNQPRDNYDAITWDHLQCYEFSDEDMERFSELDLHQIGELLRKEDRIPAYYD